MCIYVLYVVFMWIVDTNLIRQNYFIVPVEIRGYEYVADDDLIT